MCRDRHILILLKRSRSYHSFRVQDDYAFIGRAAGAQSRFKIAPIKVRFIPEQEENQNIATFHSFDNMIEPCHSGRNLFASINFQIPAAVASEKLGESAALTCIHKAVA